MGDQGGGLFPASSGIWLRGHGWWQKWGHGWWQSRWTDPTVDPREQRGEVTPLPTLPTDVERGRDCDWGSSSCHGALWCESLPIMGLCCRVGKAAMDCAGGVAVLGGMGAMAPYEH